MDGSAEHLEAALATWRKAGEYGPMRSSRSETSASCMRTRAASHRRALFEQAIAIHRYVGNRLREGVESNDLGSACRIPVA